MSTAPISSSSIYQELQAYFQQRQSEVAQLGQDLNSGNLVNAQQDFATLQSLGQGGPFANGDVFAPRNQREQDFETIGQALQSGNLSAAQQAFAQLESTFKHGGGGGSESAPEVIANAASTQALASASASASESLYQQLRDYHKQRKADIAQLGQDLQAGNTEQALQDFNALVTLGQSGPFRSGNPFANSQREQDFASVGQALQAGDLTGAQQAFAQLEATFQKHQTEPPVYNSNTSAVSPGSLLNTTA